MLFIIYFFIMLTLELKVVTYPPPPEVKNFFRSYSIGTYAPIWVHLWED